MSDSSTSSDRERDHGRGALSDQDFNFSPPPERREAKTFEPPPWERDQFDELQRRRAEQPATDAGAEAASAAPAVAPQTVAQPAIRIPEVIPETAEQAEGTAAAVAAVAPAQSVKPEVDERRVAELMFRLRAQEPPAFSDAWKYGMAAAFVSAVFGLMLVVWAIVVLVNMKRTGVTGAFGGAVMMFFGAGLTGVGAWLAVRILRQRGVL